VIGKSSDRGREQSAIAALQWADVDRAAVAEVQSFELASHERHERDWAREPFASGAP
jgi:hypothetical protein